MISESPGRPQLFLAVRAVNGYAVSLGREPSAPWPERLWFVNLGAYRPDSLAELHHSGLVVARSPQAAAKRRPAAAQGRSAGRRALACAAGASP